jgi:hypothetical protein
MRNESGLYGRLKPIIWERRPVFAASKTENRRVGAGPGRPRGTIWRLKRMILSGSDAERILRTISFSVDPEISLARPDPASVLFWLGFNILKNYERMSPN